MIPKTFSEQALFSTVQIKTDTGSGTGFFFDFNDSIKNVPMLITNKHVINDDPNKEITLTLHTIDPSTNIMENITTSYKPTWYFHSTKDLCFCLIGPLFHLLHAKGILPYFISVGEKIIATTDKLATLDALEEVTMVGYPIGLSDTINNFPIFRKGSTASHPAADFNEPGIALVDMACFPGSSGSPIYIYNKSVHSDKNGNTILGEERVILLGILFAGPTYTATGEIRISTIPTSQKVFTQTPIMTNLGYYIKAAEIFEFKSIIESIINTYNNN